MFATVTLYCISGIENYRILWIPISINVFGKLECDVIMTTFLI